MRRSKKGQPKNKTVCAYHVWSGSCRDYVQLEIGLASILMLLGSYGLHVGAVTISPGALKVVLYQDEVRYSFALEQEEKKYADAHQLSILQLADHYLARAVREEREMQKEQRTG